MASNDIAQGVQNLNIDGKRKKKPQRAYHDLNQQASTWAQSANPAQLQQQFPGQPGFAPQVEAFQQQPATQFAPQGQPIPGYQDIPAPHGHPGFQSLMPPQVPQEPVHDTSFDILGTPHAPPASSDLSLGKARYEQETEYTTLLYDEAGVCIGTKPFLSFENIVPPFAGTQYFAIDQSTATPKHMRPTFYYVPEQELMRKATRLPMAVTIRPFAPLLPNESPVPTVDMSRLGEMLLLDPQEWGPPRCRRCRTYINPQMVHTFLGRFTCNVCQFPNNAVPQEYISPIDQNENRTDRAQRPELHRGVYDIIVPDFYNDGGAENTPKPMHHVFLVDVCQQSISKSLNVLVADAIRATLFDYERENNGEKRPQKFAIILFDKAVHFFNLSPDLDSTQICVSPDLDDPFVPFYDGLFADPEESSMVIEDALRNLESLADTKSLHDSEPCFSVACRAATMCLESVGGGKITAIVSTLPSWGPGGSRLKQNKSVGRNPSAEMEKKLYSVDNEYYKLLAKDMISQNVGLDVLAVSATPVDVSNIGWLASVTGGKVHKWTDFIFDRDSRALTAQIVNSVKSSTGYQGQLKLRCSNGLQVSQYYGFPTTEGGIIGLTGNQDPVIPVLNEDQTFTVLLEYDGKLNTKYDCHLQAALLYTDTFGVRKVRVINLVCAVSERLEEIFYFVDQDAIIAALVRDTLSFVGKELIAELRTSINAKLVDVYAQYRLMEERGHNKTRSLTNQLIFPDSLRHIPLFIMALTKSKALRDSTAVPIDDRLADVYNMLNMPLERLVYHLYPALVELHSLADDECMPMENTEESFMKVPEYLPLTAHSLQPSVYILCDGTTVFVRVHPDTNKQLLADLFGEHVHQVEDIDINMDSLPEMPTHISLQARNLVRYFQKNIIGASSIGQSSVQIVIEGLEPLSKVFHDTLVEDLLSSKIASTSANYATFLTSLHKAVTAKVDTERGSYKTPVNPVHDATSFTQRMLHF